MKVVQTAVFAKAAKKLHANQKQALDEAVKTVMDNPAVGEAKAGDLSGVLVHKFKMVKQLALLAYHYHQREITLTLLMFGSHENFYRDLKRFRN